MPELGRISQIDASAFDAGSAYIAVKKPLLDDLKPYAFRTHDYGRTWTKIVNGLGPTDYVHVVREDRTRRGLLYAGTQHGVYVSYNDGDRWEPLSLNLPDVQISDLIVEDHDLVIATHGRGFYVLDNIAPLRDARAITTTTDAYLFKPADAIRGTAGATLTYLLRKPAQDLRIDILDSKGQVVNSIVGAAPPARGRRGGGQPGEAAADQPDSEDATAGRGGRGGRGGPTTTMAAGLNRTTWDLSYAGPTAFPGMVLWGATTSGPAAPPGNYQVKLTVDGHTFTQPLVVARHPLRGATDADLNEQFALAVQIRDKVSEANNAVILIRGIKEQVKDRLNKSTDPRLADAAGKLTSALSSVEEAIYQVRNQSSQDPLNFPIKINNRLASLLRVVNAGDGKPIANAEPIFRDLSAELKVQTDKLQQILGSDLPELNKEAARVGLAAVTPK